MVGGHGHRYAELPLHTPKRWQKAVGTGLCTVMWLWVIYRARKDGPVLMGWRHPWEGHGHGHGPGDRGGGGHSEKHVTERKHERTASGHKPHESEKKVSERKVAPRKEVATDEVAAKKKNQPTTAKLVPSSARGEGGQEELESKFSSSGKTRRDEGKATRSHGDSRVKQPPREKNVSAAKKEQLLQRAIEQHPELLSLLKDDQ